MDPSFLSKPRILHSNLESQTSKHLMAGWKLQHHIQHISVSGESGEVKSVTVDSWKERIPEVIADYSAQNIWNTDETGCFWKMLPDKGLGQKEKSCKGGKKCKQRVTVSFFL